MSSPFPACPDWPFATTEEISLSYSTKVECKVWKALIDSEPLSLALSHILRANQSCSIAVAKRGCCSIQTWVAGVTFVPRTQSLAAITLKEVSDGKGGRLSKEVCGGVVKLKQSKYVISRREENTYWIHMSQQRAIERNLLKCGH